MIHLPGLGRGRRLRRQADRDLELVRASDLLDPDWYLATYPDVASSGQDPYLHYMMYGGKEGRHPGPGFDSHHYLLENPEVERAGLNPLVHYLRHGRAEGRLPTPVGAFSIFDARPELAPLPLRRRDARPGAQFSHLRSPHFGEERPVPTHSARRGRREERHLARGPGRSHPPTP